MKRTGPSVALCAAVALLIVCGSPSAVSAQQPDSVLTLGEAVRRTLAAHPAIASAEAGIDGAEATASEAGSARLPRLTMEWSAVRFEEPMIVSPIHGFTPDLIPAFDRTLLQGNVAAGWLLFDGGARGARIAGARAGTAVAEASADVTRGALLARVAHSYLGVLSARQTVVAHDARIAALASARARTQQLFDEGRVARVAVLRADAAASAARADRVSAAAGLREREADLARLMGADVTSIEAVALEEMSLAAAVTEPAAPAARAAAMDRDPAVQRARQREIVAHAAVREARAGWWPSLSLSGRHHGYGAGDFDFTAEWQAGVQLSWSLFSGGARVHRIERALADERVAAAATRTARLDAAAFVDRALTALAEATARAEALEAAVAQYEEVVAVERLALSAGAGVQSDYLRAESDLLETRAALVAARHARTAAHVELARVTGELSPAWLTNNLEIRR